MPRGPAQTASSPSLNHLLNFTLPPRHSHLPSSHRRGKKSIRHGIWGRERFLNAQYRFVVTPSGDYTVHFADPDIFFQWRDILQVIVPRTSASALTSRNSSQTCAQEEGLMTCPICLSPPVAPRMTRCGHVFCFPCILHYLNLSDTTNWAPCPICFDSINEKQLKSVKWFDSPPDGHDSRISSNPSSSSIRDVNKKADPTGPLLRMRLMQRPQITTLALPRSSTWPSELLPPHQAPLHFLPDVYSFAKFMAATPEYLITDLSQEIDALAGERRVLASIKDEISLMYIDAAEERLRHQIAKAAALESPELASTVAQVRAQYEEVERRHVARAIGGRSVESSGSPLEDAPDAFLATRALHPVVAASAAPSSARFPPPPLAQETSLPKHRRNLKPPPPSTQTYYYYQSASGHPIFLHPLDIRILFSHFHSYASFPDDIIVRVEGASEGSVDDDLRKRCKYLAHMPEGADIVLVETDLSRIVGQGGLKPFESALRQRAVRRREKEKREDRARTRAEEKWRAKERLFARDVKNATADATALFDLPVPPSFGAPSSRAASPGVVEEGTGDAFVPSPVAWTPAGAWGGKSFATVLQSDPVSAPPPGLGSHPDEAVTAEKEAVTAAKYKWDLDAAFYELKVKSDGGDKKRSTKFVSLGGGTGGRKL